jgi:hypothetical protein
MREGSMKEMSDKELRAAAGSGDSQFVSIREYNQSHSVDVTVPLSVAVMTHAHAIG